MKAEWMRFLSGIGYYELSQARRRTLSTVLLISLGLHVVGLAVFGGWKIIESFRDETSVFTAPPPMKSYEPRQLEHRVKVQRRQRSSSRPQVTPRLVAHRVNQLALPEIKMDAKVVTTRFQPKFKAVTGAGLGVGLGTGYGLGGFGTGVSEFDFFGIRGRGDRVALIVDISVSMAEEAEEVGVTEAGIREFNRVKDRVGRVIDALSEQSMFTLIVFAESASTWQPELKVATAANKRAAKQFLRPFNSSMTLLGHKNGNVQRNEHGLQTAVGGGTRLDLALTAAFQQRVDTMLVICDGLPYVVRNHTEAERDEQRVELERWEKEVARAERRTSQSTEERVWVEGEPAREEVIREGRVEKARAATKGRWEIRWRGGQHPLRPPVPTPVWTLDDFIKHMALMHEELYQPEGRKMPVVHAIGYRIDRDGGRFMRDLARQYRGNYRRVASIR